MKYKYIRINKKTIAEHRHVMEQHIKRKLTSSEVVHHINGNGLDNRIENLKLFKDRREHAIHGHNKVTEFKEFNCLWCKKQTKRPLHSSWIHKFCSVSCAISFKNTQRTKRKEFTIICKNCKKPFTKIFRPCELRASPRLFCNYSCSAIYRNKFNKNFRKIVYG